MAIGSSIFRLCVNHNQDSKNTLLTILVNTLRPKQNRRHIADDIFKCILLNESVWITIKNPLKFVLKGPINNIPALVQIRAWRRPGDKPLSEPMLVSLPTHICVTRPHWVNRRLIRYQNHLFSHESVGNMLKIFRGQTIFALIIGGPRSQFQPDWTGWICINWKFEAIHCARTYFARSLWQPAV